MRKAAWILAFVVGCGSPQPRLAPALTVTWEKNMLSVTGDFPGGKIDTNFYEAFCRTGARDREWRLTTIPHRTEKISDAPLTLRSSVQGGVEVTTRITVGPGDVDFQVEAVNQGAEFVDADWVQPCIRLGGFTGCNQKTYVAQSFIYVDGVQTFLDKARRTEEAVYKGGQLYIPPGIKREDCNPRPHSPDVPSNGLIGCVSADGKWLFATAWDPCQELFQGVIVCLHSDFRLGGLKPGETKRAHGKMYIMENDSDLLVARYHRDFPR